MNFTEIIYQSALFTAIFFVFNRLFSRFIFKNREAASISSSKLTAMFVLYIVLGTSITFIIEKHGTKPSQSETQSLISGQGVIVPPIQTVSVPLKLEVTFAPQVHEQALITITTDLAEYTFSTRAASLQAMTLLWSHGKRVAMLGKGEDYFVVLLNGVTPIDYQLISSQQIQDGNAHELVYRSTQGQGIIEKKFVIAQHSYQIDIFVTCKNLSDSEQVRLFVPAPVVNDTVSGVVNIPTTSDHIKFAEIACNVSANFSQFWFEPKLFGLSTRFFANVCFASNLQANGRVYLKESVDKTVRAIFESKPFDKDAELSWSFYFGPKAEKDLREVSPALPALINYGMLSILAKPLAKLLVLVQEKTGSYGWAIMFIALLVKLLMLPVTLRGERGMRQQAEFEKKRLHLQQKFKHDKVALDQATAELIQKHGLPIFSGCLPLLLNIPVFIALNKVLTSSTELYGATFLWLPDLSASDPYYILSIVTFIGMIFAPGMQKGGGPRQIFSKVGFALFLAAATSYLASGLALFVVINTLFGVMQSFVVKKIAWLSTRYS